MGNHKTISDDLLTKEELAKRLRLRSTAVVDKMMAKREIPFIKLGHRTVRFDWPEVQIAVARLTTTAIK